MTIGIEIRRLYLDTCIDIFACEGTGDLSRRAFELLRPRSAEGWPFLCTSELSICECLVGAVRRGEPATGSIYENWTVPNPSMRSGP